MASVQSVSGSSGTVGGSSPVASFQAADNAFCATAAASTAEPVPRTLHASGPTVPPDRPAAHPDREHFLTENLEQPEHPVHHRHEEGGAERDHHHEQRHGHQARDGPFAKQ